MNKIGLHYCENRGDYKMNTNKTTLHAQDIFEKDFKTAMRGYKQEEVDAFLDIIIEDYKILQQQIEKLQLENDRLKKKTDHPRPTAPQPNPQANYDVLMRLSNLEKEVFGRKFADS